MTHSVVAIALGICLASLILGALDWIVAALVLGFLAWGAWSIATDPESLVGVLSIVGMGVIAAGILWVVERYQKRHKKIIAPFDPRKTRRAPAAND